MVVVVVVEDDDDDMMMTITGCLARLATVGLTTKIKDSRLSDGMILPYHTDTDYRYYHTDFTRYLSALYSILFSPLALLLRRYTHHGELLHPSYHSIYLLQTSSHCEY